MQCSERTVARYIASARAPLGFDPTTIIERGALIQRAQQAGAITEGMRLGPNGYIATLNGYADESLAQPAGIAAPGAPAMIVTGG